MLHSMTIRLIYVHLLETLYVKCQPGAILGQILIFKLIAISPLCYIIKYSGRICVVPTTQRL